MAHRAQDPDQDCLDYIQELRENEKTEIENLGKLAPEMQTKIGTKKKTTSSYLQCQINDSRGEKGNAEIWAKKSNIDIILLQETRVNLAGVERRKHYSIFSARAKT